MKYAIAILLLALALGGCTQLTPPTTTTFEAVASRTAQVAIYRPTLSAGDVWRVNALNRTILSWRKYRDQYGNPVGLWAGSNWELSSITIQCELKNKPDTLFYPIGLDDRKFIGGPEGGLSCIWYPTFTAPLDKVSGLPYPPYPETGYPFSYCLNTQPKAMPEQNATITVRAHAKELTVHVVATEMDSGAYTFNDSLPRSSNEADVTVDGPGPIVVDWTSGVQSDSATVDVPADWFWVEGSWTIPVGPTGCTKSGG